MRPIPKPPPFLLGAGLLFWGWHGELLTAAIPMALVIEGARLMPWRWELEAKDFYRVADLCTVLFLGVIGYQFIGGRFPEAMFMVLRWLPLAVFPLLLAQFFSIREQVPLEALFLTLRNAGRVQAEPLPPVNLGYPMPQSACWQPPRQSSLGVVLCRICGPCGVGLVAGAAAAALPGPVGSLFLAAAGFTIWDSWA